MTGLRGANGVVTAVANTLLQRNANANIFANNLGLNAASTVSAGGTTVLTAASAPFQLLTGSSNQTYQLPDATTMWIGPSFIFNNNSSGNLVITDSAASTLYTVPAGGVVIVGATSIGTSAGTWNEHPWIPSTVQWGSGTTGLVFNTALTTTPAINAGIGSSTNPSFRPYRSATTTGFGGDATNVYEIVGGAAILTSNATGTTVAGKLTVTQGTANANAIASTGYSLTGSDASSMVDLAGTWNTSGNPTAIKLNVTNTASGASALLMDLQASTVSKFKVDKNGNITVNDVTGNAGVFANYVQGVRFAAVSGGNTFTLTPTAANTISIGGADSASAVAQTVLGWGQSGTDKAGTNLTIGAGHGTGAGTPSSVILQAPVVGASGTTAQTMATILTIGSTSVTVASGKALVLGNAATTGLSAGVLAASTNASIVISDSSGQAYRIPCII